MEKSSKKRGQQERRKRVAARYYELRDRSERHFVSNFIQRLSNVREVRLWVIEWALLVLVVFLLAVVQIFWYRDSFETEAYVSGGDISEGVIGEINSMNPLYATTDAEKTLSKLLFANLVSLDRSGHLKPELAESVTTDESSKSWTVVLKERLKWSDGEPITADDIIFTFDLINDSSAKTMVSKNFSNVKIERLDARTVRFVLPSAYADFMESLEFPLVPKHVLGDTKPNLIYESKFSTEPVTSGPFVLNVLQTTNSTNSEKQTIYLTRNEHYFLRPAKLSSFTLRAYDDVDGIVSDLRDSKITATAALNRETAASLPDTIKRRTSALNGGVFAFLNLRSESGVMGKAGVRRAIQRGVNMATVRDGLDAQLKLDYPILPNQFEDLSFPEIPGYDIAEAKKLLEASGYSFDNDELVDKNGDRVTLKLAVQDRPVIRDSAERFARELRTLGFDVAMNKFDESSSASVDFFSAVIKPRDYDILFYEVDLGINVDPFVYYSSTQTGEKGWNFSEYSNSLVDDALLSARSTSRANLRKNKYETFLKYWLNDVPAIGIYRSSLDYYFAQNIDIYSENLQMADALDRFTDVRDWGSAKRRVNLTP